MIGRGVLRGRDISAARNVSAEADESSSRIVLRILISLFRNANAAPHELDFLADSGSSSSGYTLTLPAISAKVGNTVNKRVNNETLSLSLSH